MSRPSDQSFAMKHWLETGDIARRIGEGAAGHQLAVATVVDIRGSAYRRPGAKLLIESGGALRGGVSGGCLEADVHEIGLDAIRTRRACSRQYQTGVDEDTVWGLGLGCEGTVEVFVQPVEPEAIPTWQAIAQLLEGDAPFAITTVLTGPATGRLLVVVGERLVAGGTGDGALDDGIASSARALIAEGGSALTQVEASRVFTEVLTAPPWLAVFGAGDDAIPLVRLATGVGFRVAVIDHRPAFATAERFPEAHRLLIRRAEGGVDDLRLDPDAAAVVMTHTLEYDRAWVDALLATAIRYIGVLGPRSRIARVMEQTDERAASRVFGPVGLDIGAEGPEQIALSVLGEILAVRGGRTGRPLRERDAAIHA